MTGVSNKKGFTLVEMLITAVVFSIIFGAAVATFASAAKIQKYNLSQQQLLDQGSYAMEYMARALRMAQKDDNSTLNGACAGLGQNYKISNSGKRIDFVNYNGVCQHFLWDSNSGSSQIRVGGSVFNSDTPLTSDKYAINNLSFIVNGDSLGDTLQPRVTIFMNMQDNRLPQDKPKIKLQTTVSQRNLDE